MIQVLQIVRKSQLDHWATKSLDRSQCVRLRLLITLILLNMIVSTKEIIYLNILQNKDLPAVSGC